MKNEELLKCPLIRGLDPMRRAEVIGLLNDSKLGEQLEQCVARFCHPDDEPKEAAAEKTGPADFEKDVHNWNPEVPIWRRSSKE
jgi:hypothetical protein